MNFSLANNGPIGITIDGISYLLPRFKRKDWLAWAAEVDAKRLSAATDGMDPAKRFKLLSIYPVAGVDTTDLSRLAFTPAGCERLIRTCMVRGGVPADVIDKVLDEGAVRDLEALALMLASVIDPDNSTPAEPATEGQEDPLADAGTDLPG